MTTDTELLIIDDESEILIEGEPLSLREIAQRCGIKASTLRHRIKSQGMTLQQAISK